MASGVELACAGSLEMLEAVEEDLFQHSKIDARGFSVWRLSC